MFNILELQQARAHKAANAKEIVDRAEKDEKGPRPMSAEECTFFDAQMRDVAELDAKIVDVQAHLDRRAKQQQLEDRLNTHPGRSTQPDPVAPQNGTTSVTPFRLPATARRTGKLKAFKGPSAEEKAYRAGMWVPAHFFRDIRAQAYCVQNALGTTSNTDGGFLVPDELSEAIIDLREEYGVFRRECRVWPMGSDTLMIPRRAGGVTVGALGENPSAAPTATNPTWDMVQLVAKKAGGLCVMSSEIAEDAVLDIADWVAQEYAYAFALFEDQCGFIGDGTSTYLGIRGLTNLLTEASGLAGAVTVATATHDLFSELDATDLATVMAKLPQYAKMNAKWYCSSVCDELVFGRLMAGAGGNTTDNIAGLRQRSYLGYPIVISQVLPSVLTSLDALPMLFFGDLRKSSALGDRRMVRVFPSEHRYMELDQIGVLATERIDIINHDVGTTTAAGPIVALTGSSS